MKRLGKGLAAAPGRKGDVDRYILWTIVLLILLILIVALFYSGAYTLLQKLLIKNYIR
jgi:hypothetical protein